MIEHFCLKIEETLKNSYSLYSITLSNSDWKYKLAADSNLPKLNAYSFHHPDYSNPQFILPQQSISTHPRLPHLQRKIIRNKRDKLRKYNIRNQMRRTASQFRTNL